MAWEKRRNSRYYYRKQWVDGTCQSEYIGAGMFAECTATLQEMDNQKAAFERVLWRAEIEPEEEADRQVREVIGMIRTLRNAVLLASGYHQHKGQWRKRRE